MFIHTNNNNMLLLVVVVVIEWMDGWIVGRDPFVLA
jgi:hypothetical protein